MAGPVEVFGVLSDISDIPLKYNPQLVFRPDEPGTNLESFSIGGVFRAAGGSLYGTGNVVVTPSSSGYFSVSLHPTSDLVRMDGKRGPITYTVTIVWTDPVHGQVARDFIKGFRVSDSGGSIGSQIKTALPGWLFWAGPTLPAQYNTPGNYWWNTDTDDIWKVV